MTDLVHSSGEREKAVAAAAALFGQSDLRALTDDVIGAVMAEVGAADLSVGPTAPTVLDVLAASGVVASRSAGRRAVAEGGAYLNNIRVVDPDASLADSDVLPGRYVVARRGKRTVGAVRLVGD